LVVIIILTTIVGAAIPVLAPAGDDRRLREATRGLNTYITGAQARAIAEHRPFGIALKRLGQETGKADDRAACLEVYYVEQQAPYAGFDANSRACVALCPSNNLRQLGILMVRMVTRGNQRTPAQDRLPMGWEADLFPTAMLRPGDVIETGGTRFVLINPVLYPGGDQAANVFVDTDNQSPTVGYFMPPQGGVPTLLVKAVNDSGQQIIPEYESRSGRALRDAPFPPNASALPPYWTGPAPYQVLRQATPTSDEPYQLPAGTAIDLRASGVGSDNFFYEQGTVDNSDGVLVMFAPEGRVARVSYSLAPPNNEAAFDKPVADNVYLLVGKRENIPVPTEANDPSLQTVPSTATEEQRQEIREPINWLAGTSRWIVIGSLSGRIVTIENAFVPLLEIAATGTPEELRKKQILDARKFTSEMAQLGGR
jgi:hypothetical protein